MGSDVIPKGRLEPEEKALAARFVEDARRFCVWLAERLPAIPLEDVLSAGGFGLVIGAKSAASRLGAEPTEDALRDHLMRNVGWRVRALAKDRAAKRQRRERAGATTSFIDDAFEDASAIVPDRTNRLTAEDLDDLARARAALDALPETDRAIVQGRCDGRPLRELGEELGLSRQGVLNIFNRTVARLREQLDR